MICEVVKYAFETLHGKFAVIDSAVFAAGILFLGDVFIPKAIDFSDYPMLHSVFVVFLGLFLESIPFLFLGAIASSFIQLFISEEIIQRMIPKSP